MNVMYKKYLFILLKLCISVALIWFIALNFDIGSAGVRLKNIQYIFIFAAFLIFLLLLVNNSARWLLVMKAIDVKLPLDITLKIICISSFFNQTLPSTIGGDVVRILLSRKAGVSFKGAVNGVMLERVATLSGLIFLTLISQPFLLARIGDNPAKYVFPVLAMLAFTGIIILMLLDRLPKRLHSLKFVRSLDHFAADAKKIFLSPRYASIAIFLGATGQILISFMAFFAAKALLIDISITDCLILMPPVMLIIILPISIAGWGVRESAMVAAFSLVGVLEGDAFVMSVLFGLINILFSLPGGLLWLIGGYSSGLAKKM